MAPDTIQLLIDKIRMIHLHAVQGTHDPKHAKDQCHDIAALAISCRNILDEQKRKVGQ